MNNKTMIIVLLGVFGGYVTKIYTLPLTDMLFRSVILGVIVTVFVEIVDWLDDWGKMNEF